MPYKHIAAHLKKTELACRLHYHQLSHGSNRRKRTNSHSSSSTSSVTHSPAMSHSMPSPVNESIQPTTPPSYHYSPQSPPHVQLPSAASLLQSSDSCSPPLRNLGHPVAILPKPSPNYESAMNAPLHLDCDVSSGPINFTNVDQDRLRQIYESHQASFWSVIASEYGPGASPVLLEESWKRRFALGVPPTPCTSPESQTAVGGGAYQAYVSKPFYRLPTPVQETKPHSASISALLGIVSSPHRNAVLASLTISKDASPRSPEEREMIKRMEERREHQGIIMGDSSQRYQ